ncbi:triose-phosphate isomerase [Candidatus Woesearchaeota archaeon RBG_13_36_6]|nr:MAG: triose-phosphate isomerase [Candidatus Woesearchaeota archaeon RBG_13_36_6]
MIKTPCIVVNFKTYEQGSGKKAVKLAKICEKVAKTTKKSIAIAVQEADIYRVSQTVSIPVFAQHIDPITDGAHTGHTLSETIKEAGAQGTLINHSEDQFDLQKIKTAIERAKQVGLQTIVCASNPEIATKIAEFNPDIIAIEPPELIGGEISVSTAKPEIISKTIDKVHNIKKIPVICGAGIKDKKDVIIAIKLGAVGVLPSSHVVKARDPEKILRELAEGLG